jgi:hypothetical protein
MRLQCLSRSFGSILMISCASAIATAEPTTGVGADKFLALDRELATLAEPRPAVAPVARQGDPALSSSITEVLVLLGARSLDDSTAWDQIDEPFAFGMEFASRRRGSWLGFEGGFQLAYDEATFLGVDVDDLFLELYLGGRITGDLGPEGRIHPYVGVGGSLTYAEVTGESGGLSVSDEDSSIGLYGHAGVHVRLGGAFLLGLDARAVTGTDVSLFGVDTDADYTQIALLMGWSA